MSWKRSLHYEPFVSAIQWSQVDDLHKRPVMQFYRTEMLPDQLLFDNSDCWNFSSYAAKLYHPVIKFSSITTKVSQRLEAIDLNESIT